VILVTRERRFHFFSTAPTADCPFWRPSYSFLSGVITSLPEHHMVKICQLAVVALLFVTSQCTCSCTHVSATATASHCSTDSATILNARNWVGS
jgi:hypothetical protein